MSRNAIESRAACVFSLWHMKSIPWAWASTCMKTLFDSVMIVLCVFERHVDVFTESGFDAFCVVLRFGQFADVSCEGSGNMCFHLLGGAHCSCLMIVLGLFLQAFNVWLG